MSFPLVRRCLIAILLGTFLPRLALAQAAVAFEVVPPAPTTTIRSATTEKQQRQYFERYLDMLIHDMQDVCHLDDKQVAKLRLAGKGFIKRQLESHKTGKYAPPAALRLGVAKPKVNQVQLPAEIDVREVKKQQEAQVRAAKELQTKKVADAKAAALQAAREAEKRRAVAIERAQAVRAVVAAEAGVALNIVPADAQREIRVWNAVSASGFTSGVDAIRNDTFWQKSVEKVLSKDQRSQYENALQAREQRKRQARVAAKLADLDERLLLTKKQREQVKQLLTTDSGKKAAPDNQINQLVWQRVSRGEFELVLTEDNLKKILSDSQLDEWKSKQRNRWQPGAVEVQFVR